jgi:hypothetical protein
MDVWRKRAWWFAGGLLLVLLPGLVLACSDNNNDDPGPSSPAISEQSSGDAPTDQLRAATEAVPTPTTRPVGTDAEYVKGLCTAMTQFFTDVEAATRSITPTDPAGVARDFAAAFGPPLTRFKEDLNQIAPPADVMAWHDKTAEELGHIAEGIMAGRGLTEIARLGDHPLPDLPPDISARIAAAAYATPECQQFEDAFAG